MFFIDSIGSNVRKRLSNIFYALGFFFKVLKETILIGRQKQVGFKVLVMQIYFTGVEAINIISLLALGLGAVIIIQGLTILMQYSQTKFIYVILIMVITRELGPILTAFIIIARSGTAIATEIGNMVVSHEIEAYTAVGINPISYLVVPRFLGVTISLIILTLYFNYFGLFASFLVTQLFTTTPFDEYVQNILSELSLAAIFSSLVKSLAFGMIISIVSCYQGFKVKYASTEIPQVVIKAVVQSFALCIVADVLLVALFQPFQ
ncbi:MAG: ABC transporter permease [Spirochaetaceae bacterium]|nr:MAG: ABC transporter permease [Spirochaetaceae bacterium]